MIVNSGQSLEPVLARHFELDYLPEEYEKESMAMKTRENKAMF